jgi:hypothetical protein
MAETCPTCGSTPGFVSQEKYEAASRRMTRYRRALYIACGQDEGRVQTAFAAADGVPILRPNQWGGWTAVEPSQVSVGYYPSERPPCTVCAKSASEHGSYPTCATHPYTGDGNCQYVVGAACVGAECIQGCVRGRGIAGVLVGCHQVTDTGPSVPAGKAQP